MHHMLPDAAPRASVEKAINAWKVTSSIAKAPSRIGVRGPPVGDAGLANMALAALRQANGASANWIDMRGMTVAGQRTRLYASPDRSLQQARSGAVLCRAQNAGACIRNSRRASSRRMVRCQASGAASCLSQRRRAPQ